MPTPPTGRILVVDDETDLAQLVAEYLRKAGLDMRAVPGGVGAGATS